jgi:hypothetical protein
LIFQSRSSLGHSRLKAAVTSPAIISEDKTYAERSLAIESVSFPGGVTHVTFTRR